MGAPATCPFCAEPLVAAGPRCTACGEVVDRGLVPAPPPARPVGPKVIGGLSVFFGAAGLLGPVVFVATQALGLKDPNDPMQAALASSAFFRAWTYGSQVLGTVASVALLASGFGQWTWREWARRLGLGLAVYQLVMLVVAMTITYGYVLQPMLGKLGGNPIVVGAVTGGLVGGACFGALFPIATLVVLRRPAVREAFAAEEAARARGTT